MRLRRNRPVALLAIFVVALSALWPLVAQARPQVPGTLVPVCTIDGVTHYSELPAPKPPVEQRSDAHHEHCKMCLFGAERACIAAAPEPLGVSSGNDVPSRSIEVERGEARFDDRARPRAPPALFS